MFACSVFPHALWKVTASKNTHNAISNCEVSDLQSFEKKLKIERQFRRILKITKSDYELRHVCLSVRIEQLGHHWTDFNEI
jgi:predicted metalloenzyme YecM